MDYLNFSYFLDLFRPNIFSVLTHLKYYRSIQIHLDSWQQSFTEVRENIRINIKNLVKNRNQKVEFSFFYTQSFRSEKRSYRQYVYRTALCRVDVYRTALCRVVSDIACQCQVSVRNVVRPKCKILYRPTYLRLRQSANQNRIVSPKISKPQSES